MRNGEGGMDREEKPKLNEHNENSSREGKDAPSTV